MTTPSTIHTVSDLGEDALIQRLQRVFSYSATPGVLGIGDDCAVLAPNAMGTLLTTDSVLEGVHFRREWSTADDVGWKAAAVNASDIAAMGGSPRFALLSLALPAELPLTWFDGLIAGVHELTGSIGVQIIGGNMSRALSGIQVGMTMLGDAPQGGAKLRSGARAGDVLCVTGPVGSARGGLLVLQQGGGADERWGELVQQQRRPSPHVREGGILGAEPAVHALMDLSDGLAIDLPRLLAASAVGASVQLESLPVLPSLKAYCEAAKLPTEEFAFGGGEDYVLLAAVAASDFDEVAERFRAVCDRKLFRIGKCVEGSGVNVTLRGSAVSFGADSFQHFEARR